MLKACPSHESRSLIIRTLHAPFSYSEGIGLQRGPKLTSLVARNICVGFAEVSRIRRECSQCHANVTREIEMNLPFVFYYWVKSDEEFKFVYQCNIQYIY
jgi:hypothetical protein